MTIIEVFFVTIKEKIKRPNGKKKKTQIDK